LIQTVTMNDVMPFHILINSDSEVILMSLHVFFTLQIPVSSLTPTSPIRGPSGDVMETHKNVVLPITLGATNDFKTFLVNFLIISPMLPYEAILTWGSTKLRWHRHQSLPPQCPTGFCQSAGM
jgi:hypothetical protein